MTKKCGAETTQGESGSMTKQRGTFSYPGSKTLIRRWVIDKFPEHHLYVEPFGGAASILVGKDRSKVEVYNDINSDCIKFFEAVKHHGEELAEWVDNTPYSRELFEQWCSEYPAWPDDVVERAGRFLFVQDAAFGGKGVVDNSPYFSVAKVDTRPDAINSKQWHRKPNDIEWLKERFKGVQIEHEDYAKVFDRYDDPEAFFYCDPPYVDVGDGYYQTEDGGFDHRRFTEELTNLDAKWLVSYDENIPEELCDYHTVNRSKVSTISAQRPEKTESLVMNYDPNAVGMFKPNQQQGLGAYND